MTATMDAPEGTARTLGIELRADELRSIVDVQRLAGVAVRRNPRRAHLLVSTVLAKHVPTVPGLSLAAGELLGLLASGAVGGVVPDEAAELGGRFAELLDGGVQAGDLLPELRDRIRAATPTRPDVVTFGYAETATGLGQIVADSLGSYYLHSTRHAPDGATPFAGFAEEHSHATDHDLLPTDPAWLKPGGVVVLVDDELSTGTTVINTISALHAHVPQAHWVVASLIDLRSEADRQRFDQLADSLDTRISVVCLGAGEISLPVDVLSRAADWLHRMPGGGDSPQGGAGDVTVVDCADLPAVRSARFGTTGPLDARTAAAIAERIRAAMPAAEPPASPQRGRRLLVVGSEEFIALPMLIAHELDTSMPSVEVRFSTSTRSPIATLDQPGYPIRSAVRFTSHDLTSDGIGPRFAYNLTAGGRRFDTIVFLAEPGIAPALLGLPGGALEALRAVCDRVVVVALDAEHPGSGSASGTSIA